MRFFRHLIAGALVALLAASAAQATGSLHIEYLKGDYVYSSETISSSGASAAGTAAPAGTGQARITAVGGAVVVKYGGTAPVATQTNGIRLQVGWSPVLVPLSAGEKIAIIEATDAPASAGGGGGGGGAATIADGADVIEGASTDTSATASVFGNLIAIKANTSGLALESGGNIAAVKADLDALVAAAANPAPVTQSGPWTNVGVQGTTASGATQTDNPLADGCRAATTQPTAVTDGQKVGVMCTVSGKVVTSPYAFPENYVSGTTSAMTGTTSTLVLAAPAAGLRNYVTNITCVNSHASVGTLVTVQDGSGGTALYTLAAASLFGGSSVVFPTPLRQPTTATGMYVANVTTGANDFCSMTGFKAP